MAVKEFDTAARIDAAAWTVLVLGILCLVLGAFQAVIPFVLDRLAGALDDPADPMKPLRDALAAGAGVSALLNVVFGAAAIVVGIAVARRARWAHRAFVILCWGSLVILVGLAQPSLAPIFVMAGGRGSVRGTIGVIAVVLLVAQVVAVLWFLRFWRRDEVRAAFR